MIFGTDFRRSRTVVAVPQILIYSIRMQGMLAAGSRCMRKPELAGIVSLIWGGVPVSVGTIDAMQFVMLRDIWLNEGGWSDKRWNSDGILYKRFAEKYAVRAVSEILGEHW